MIKDYPGAKEELQRANYNWGISLLEVGEVQRAIDVFMELGDYEKALTT